MRDKTEVSESIRMAVINAWEAMAHVPYPLYNSEADAIGRAVIDVFIAETVLANNDRLTAERDRLRGEIDRLLRHDGDAIAVCDSYAVENQQFSDRMEALGAEVERLQSLAANAALNGCETTLDAANEANQLRAEKAELVAALSNLIGICDDKHPIPTTRMLIENANAVLAKAIATDMESGE